MKRLLFFIPAIASLLMPISCSDQLDINTNPLSASKADPNAVLPFVIVQYSNRKTTELGTRMHDVYQFFSNTFNSPKTGGNTAGGFLSGNYWGMLYNQALSNLTLVESDARAAGATNNNVTAIALILKALAFFDATSCWENIPFTQALNASAFPQPEFDSQEVVLNGLVDMLDEAITLIDNTPATGTFNVSQGDLIYGGNMANWKRYANSLKIRILMMIRNRDTSVDSKIITALSQPVVETNGQVAMLRYSGTAGNVNAWKLIVTAFGTGSNETTNYFGPSPVIRELLEGDPRLQLYCIDGTNGGYEAQPIGVFPNNTKARYSDNLIRGSLPDVWMLPAEITLYRAELAAKGVLAGDVNALYRLGVTQTLEFWGQTIPGALQTLTQAQITNFVTSLTDLNTLTPAEQVQRIGEQQYLETFWRPIEGWNHVRRTKIPDIQAAPGSDIATMLKRLQWSPTEVAANPNNPVQPSTDLPMWFEN
ncbi:MAG: SusD/RagB family nutrient-binding outer membrane lipoprotein [Cyclobacteriaceae bacterium]|nr:SusD/RagB family nutrient-binding outer membrane lipoprotein [Cyclobacteriaceae bacterium]